MFHVKHIRKNVSRETILEDKTMGKWQDFDDYFNKASTTYNVDKRLLIAVAKTESDFNPKATSGAGAKGIMQLMDGTAKSLGVTNSYDAEQNIMGGAKYLSQ